MPMLVVFAMSLFLSFAALPAAGAEPDAVTNALQQAREAAKAMTDARPEETQHEAAVREPGTGDVAVPTPGGENTDPEQATYPGVRNQILKSGGDGNPTTALWYPQFGNATVDKAMHDFVTSVAADYESECRDSIGEDGQKPESFGQWEQSGFFTLARPNADIASITFNIYSYTGGAHGQIYIIVQNWDLKTGKQLAIGDIFGDVPQALQILSEYCAASLRKSLGEDTDEEMLSDGTEPTEANFSALSLSPDGLTVEFQPYQVGPWSIGQPHVQVPLSQLTPARPSALVWPTAK